MPSTPPTQSQQTKKGYHHGDLKSSLIQAANVILLRDGADSLSLRAIAAEVGVSHMAPYSHFKNKKELVQSVASAGFDHLADAMEAKTDSLKKPGELILAYGVAYLDFAIGNPQLYRLMLGQVETKGRKASKGSLGDKKAPTENAKSSEMFTSSKRPFILLREAFSKREENEGSVKAQALGAWSMVHGMSALIIEGHIQVPEGVSMKQFLAASTLHASSFLNDI